MPTTKYRSSKFRLIKSHF